MINREYTLQASHLSCVRQQKMLFGDISFELQSGQALLIEGENGSGKSSLLRLLSGLSTPAEGNILWCGQAIQSIRDDYAQCLHYLGHSNGIKQGLTIAENLQLLNCISLAMPANELTKKIDAVLEELQILAFKNTYVKNLSAGQKRRVALAKLFLIPKKIWILDEPLTALDTNAQTFFLNKLEIHLQGGGIAIISSHHAMTFTNAAAIKNLRLISC
jgi:heme exporter protein A